MNDFLRDSERRKFLKDAGALGAAIATGFPAIISA